MAINLNTLDPEDWDEVIEPKYDRRPRQKSSGNRYLVLEED